MKGRLVQRLDEGAIIAAMERRLRPVRWPRRRRRWAGPGGLLLRGGSEEGDRRPEVQVGRKGEPGACGELAGRAWGRRKTLRGWRPDCAVAGRTDRDLASEPLGGQRAMPILACAVPWAGASQVAASIAFGEARKRETQGYGCFCTAIAARDTNCCQVPGYRADRASIGDRQCAADWRRKRAFALAGGGSAGRGQLSEHALQIRKIRAIEGFTPCASAVHLSPIGPADFDPLDPA